MYLCASMGNFTYYFHLQAFLIINFLIIGVILNIFLLLSYLIVQIKGDFKSRFVCQGNLNVSNF